jgi:RHS repeat-associated protein
MRTVILQYTTTNRYELIPTDRYIYGSARLGSFSEKKLIKYTGNNMPVSISNYTMSTKKSIIATQRTLCMRIPGLRQYELTDHLGNVRVVFADEKQCVLNGSAPNIVMDKITIEPNAYYNMYAYGMPKSHSSNDLLGNYYVNNPDKVYRYGFNGQEKVDEISGVGNHNTVSSFGREEYDTRLGRRWNVDPVDQMSISNYACFGNNPISNVDPKGNTFYLQLYTQNELNFALATLMVIASTKKGMEMIVDLNYKTLKNYYSHYAAKSETDDSKATSAVNFFNVFHVIHEMKHFHFYFKVNEYCDANPGAAYYMRFSKEELESKAVEMENYLSSVFNHSKQLYRKHYELTKWERWDNFITEFDESKFLELLNRDPNAIGESVSNFKVIQKSKFNLSLENLYQVEIKNISEAEYSKLEKDENANIASFEYQANAKSKTETRYIISTFSPRRK